MMMKTCRLRMASTLNFSHDYEFNCVDKCILNGDRTFTVHFFLPIKIKTGLVKFDKFISFVSTDQYINVSLELLTLNCRFYFQCKALFGYYNKKYFNAHTICSVSNNGLFPVMTVNVMFTSHSSVFRVDASFLRN